MKSQGDGGNFDKFFFVKRLLLIKKEFLCFFFLATFGCVENLQDSGDQSSLPRLSGISTSVLPQKRNVEQIDFGGATKQVQVDQEGIIVNETLSDENDFAAVSSRETIESDAQRIAINRALYEVFEPTDLPIRSETGTPNIVAFALKTTNPLKVTLYNRGPFSSEKRAMVNCNKYASPSMAQEVFLSKGGPKRDLLGLDPDGDGYACAWDPTPFRLARSEE